jgi:S-formylglutathione hydrolase FrmB
MLTDALYAGLKRPGRRARHVLSEAIPAGIERFCAAGAHSPALWQRAGDTPPGAFDDAADFARADPIGAARRGLRPDAPVVWIDIGEDDPFLAATRAFGAAAGERVRVRRGGHGQRYWSKHMAGYLRFYARALDRC